jgi:hypothetical protein
MISEPLEKKRVSRAAKSYVMRVDAVACLRSGAAAGCLWALPGLPGLGRWFGGGDEGSGGACACAAARGREVDWM